MSEPLSSPATARILQVSLCETITYDMPYVTYELIRDVMDTWRCFHERRDKPTVEKVLQQIEMCAVPNIRDGIVVKREATVPKVKGVRADTVWTDDPLVWDEVASGQWKRLTEEST